MRTTVLTRDSQLTDSSCLDQLPQRGLGVGDLEAAGWGTSWQPDDRPRLSWLDADEPFTPGQDPVASAKAWDFWLILERLSP